MKGNKIQGLTQNVRETYITRPTEKLKARKKAPEGKLAREKSIFLKVEDHSNEKCQVQKGEPTSSEKKGKNPVWQGQKKRNPAVGADLRRTKDQKEKRSKAKHSSISGKEVLGGL